MIPRIPTFGRIARYAAGIVLRHQLGLMAILVGAFVVLDGVEAAQRPDAVAARELARLLAVLPHLVSVGIVAGACSATAALGRNGERQAIEAAGASPFGLVQPALVLGALWGLLFFGLDGFVAPAARGRLARPDPARPVWSGGPERFVFRPEGGPGQGFTVRDGRVVQRWKAGPWDGRAPRSPATVTTPRLGTAAEVAIAAGRSPRPWRWAQASRRWRIALAFLGSAAGVLLGLALPRALGPGLALGAGLAVAFAVWGVGDLGRLLARTGVLGPALAAALPTVGLVASLGAAWWASRLGARPANHLDAPAGPQ